MKKIIFLSLAILLIGSLAYGHQISSDPSGSMTSQFPGVKIDVYSAAALEAGDVVIWAIQDSTGDNDAWVEGTTTADTGLVAGVIWPNAIGAGASGSMVIYGMAECDTNSLGVAEGGLLCTSTTSGNGGNCAATDGSGRYAIATAAIGQTSQGKCFVTID